MAEKSNESCAKGPTIPEVRYVTIPHLTDQRANQAPDKVAHVFYTNVGQTYEDIKQSREAITFKDLAEKSLILAGSLLKLGIKPGDHIALVGTKSTPEFLYLEHACLRIKVLLLKLSSSGLIQDVIKDYHCIAVVFVDWELLTDVSRNNFNLFNDCLKHIFLLHNNPSKDQDTHNSVNLNHVREIADLLKMHELCKSDVKLIQDSINPEDIACILTTSGSTGKPKFIQHSHFAMINGTVQMHHASFGWNTHGDAEDGIYFNDRSFAWIGGWQFVSVCFGMTMIYLDTTLSLEGGKTPFILDVMEKENVTNAVAMPYLLHDFIEMHKKGNLHLPCMLRSFLTGGQALSKEIIEFSMAYLPKFSVSYGNSESFCCMLGTMSESDGSQNWLTVMPHNEIRITDSSGAILPRGTPENIMLSSPFITKGYMGVSETPLDLDGWFDMQDVGVMKDDGKIAIIGRTKDVISRGTLKIYPKDIEVSLTKHSKVAQCVALGVPDPRLYEEICACVVPEPGSSLTEKELKGLWSANETQPKYYVIMDEFPLQKISNKIDMVKLRDIARTSCNNDNE